MHARWITQNEATDAEGFLLEGEASFAAEMEFLASVGCPDTAFARLVSVEVIGREESVTTAEVTASMAQCLKDELDAEADDP